jgi:hypothetical protein
MSQARSLCAVFGANKESFLPQTRRIYLKPLAFKAEGRSECAVEHKDREEVYLKS